MCYLTRNWNYICRGKGITILSSTQSRQVPMGLLLYAIRVSGWALFGQPFRSADFRITAVFRYLFEC